MSKDIAVDTLQVGLADPVIFANIIDITTDAVIAVDEDQRIRLFNQGAERIFGYRAEELLGQPLDLLLPPRLVRVHRQHIRAFAAAPEVARRMGERRQLFGRRKDGSEFPAEASISKLARNGQTIFTAILRDITERKRREEALRWQNDLYEALLKGQSNLGEGVALVDGHTQRFLHVNEALCRMYGYTAEELLALPSFFALVPPDELELLRERLRQRMEGSQNVPDHYEMVVTRRDGARLNIEVAVKRAETGDGTKLVAIIRDITERKRAEEALRDQAELLQLAHGSIIVRDLDSRIVFWNRGAENTYGWTQTEATGQVTHRLLQTQFPEPFEEIDAQLLRTGYWEGELVHTKRDGTRITVASRQALRRDEQGRPVAILEINNDITARKEAEEALRQSEERFRRLAENASDLIYRVHLLPTPGIDYVSPSMIAILGYTLEDFNADPDLGNKIIHPDDRKHSQAFGEAFMKSPGSVSEPLALRYIHKDGRVVWVEHRIVPIYDAAGNLVAVEGIGRDITERVQAYQLLEQRVEERTREIERRRQVAEGLRDIVTILNSNRPLEIILDDIVGQAGRLLGADAVAVYRRQEQEGTLTIQASRGLDLDYVTYAGIPIGRGAVGQAVLQRQPVAISDVVTVLPEDSQLQVDPQQRALLALLAQRYRSLLAVPIMIKAENYGGIVLYYAEPRQFSDEDIRLAVAFADQVALALENARLRTEAEQAAVAAERNRLARDLHDAVTQTLFSANLIAEVLPRLWERDRDEGQRRLEELRQLTSGALAEMRTLLLELRPVTLTEMKLADLLGQLAEAVTGRTRVPVSVTIDGHRDLPLHVRTALYRIAQEALNNVGRHAKAGRAEASLRFQPEGAVELLISDDGRGFNPEGIPPEHLGLGIMRERAEAIGATLRIDSQPGHGTKVVVRWQDLGGDHNGHSTPDSSADR